MKTAEEYRNEAKFWQDKEQASWERSDTDGFVSQWCHSLARDEALLNAKIAENNGLHRFLGLYHGNRRVSAKIITTRFGVCWFLKPNEVNYFGRKFIPTGSKSRIQKKLGLREALEWDKAKAITTGSGTGMSGLATCHVVAVRVGDEWGLNAEIDKNERR